MKGLWFSKDLWPTGLCNLWPVHTTGGSHNMRGNELLGQVDNLCALFLLIRCLNHAQTCTHVAFDTVAPWPCTHVRSTSCQQYCDTYNWSLKCMIPPLSPFTEITILCCLFVSAWTKQKHSCAWKQSLVIYIVSDLVVRPTRIWKNWPTWADNTLCIPVKYGFITEVQIRVKFLFVSS